MKTLKLKSDIPQKVGRVIIWTLIVFLMLRGIGSVFKPSETKTAKDVIAEYTREADQHKKVELEASAAAQGFIKEYLTYNGAAGQEDYTNRLKKYFASYVELPQSIAGDTRSEVLSSDVTAIKWVSGNQMNVDVRAKVRYTIKVKPENTTKTDLIDKNIISDCSMRIPIAIQDNKYAVEDIPVFIADTDKAAIKLNPYSGAELDANQAKEVKQTIENFFKTYYSGDGTELTYYLSDSKKQIKGLDKRFEFQKLDNVNVYEVKETKEIMSLVTLTVKDSVNGQLMPQKYNIKLVRKDNKLYIDTFDVRTSNFN